MTICVQQMYNHDDVTSVGMKPLKNRSKLLKWSVYCCLIGFSMFEFVRVDWSIIIVYKGGIPISQ